MSIDRTAFDALIDSNGTPGHGSVWDKAAIADVILDPVDAAFADRGDSVTSYGAIGNGTADDTSAIQDAIDTVSVAGGTVFFPPGTYKITSELLVDAHGVHLVGSGANATVLLFAPTANGTCLKFQYSSASVLRHCSLRGLSFYSTDSTYTKTAIELVDVSKFVLREVFVWGGVEANSTFFWSGGTGSIGLRTRGRELSSVSDYQFQADKPIQISENPNSSLDLDVFSFRDGYVVANGFPNITIDTGCNLTSITVDQLVMALGTGGVSWVDTTSVAISFCISFHNTRWEQAPSGGWAFDIQHNLSLYQLNIDVCEVGGTSVNGIRLRTARWVTVKNYLFVESSGTSLDCNSTVYPLILQNCWSPSGTTVTLGATKRFAIPDQSVQTGTPMPLFAVYTSEVNEATNIGRPIATASLPAAASAMDGTVLIEDAGAGDRNLIIYGGGQRFRIDGGSSF